MLTQALASDLWPRTCEDCETRRAVGLYRQWDPCRTACWRTQWDAEEHALATLGVLAHRGRRISTEDGRMRDIWRVDPGMLALLLRTQHQAVALLLVSYEPGDIVEMVHRLAALRTASPAQVDIDGEDQ